MDRPAKVVHDSQLSVFKDLVSYSSFMASYVRMFVSKYRKFLLGSLVEQLRNS